MYGRETPLERAYDKAQDKQQRTEAYKDSISKASNKLKSLNRKKQLTDAESSIEEKHFEVVRDPLDGNIYLQLEPHELHKYSPDEIKRIE